MIRKLLATTAIATLLASGAIAQTTTEDPAATGGAATDTTTQAPAATGGAAAPAAMDAAPAATDAAPAATESATPAATEMAPEVTADGQLASDLIGTRVFNGTGDDAENVGEVNDIVLGADGMIQAVVIGVGGFLGIGEKDVAVDYKTVKWTERDNDRWLVIASTKEELEAQVAFDRSAYDRNRTAGAVDGNTDTMAETPAATTTAEPADTMAAAPADTTTAAPVDGATATDTIPDGTAADTAAADTAAAPAATDTTADPAATDTTAAAPASTDTTQTAAIDRSTLTDVDVGTLRAEDFVGTTVYGANEERVGEIGDVALAEDGKVDSVIIDVGGFLGMGEKEVAVGFDNLKFMQDSSGNRYLYTEFTKEQLEAQPAYEKDSYAQNRDTQRLTVQ